MEQKYIPTPEEIEKTKDMMNYQQEIMSDAREKSFSTREAEGFAIIDPKTVYSDTVFLSFLINARVSRSRRGDGVFISGEHGVDTSKFRKYGIPVAGALIVPARENPDLEVERISSLIRMLNQDLEYEKQKKGNQEKESAQKIADEEFDKRMKNFQPIIQELQKVVDAYKDSLGAHIITDKDGDVRLLAGKVNIGLIFLAPDYDLPDNIRHLRKMPKLEQVSKSDDLKNILEKELIVGPIRERLIPKIKEVEHRLIERIGDKCVYKDKLSGRSETYYFGSRAVSEYVNYFIFLGQEFEWSDQGFLNFAKLAEDIISDAEVADENGWRELKPMNIVNVPVSLTNVDGLPTNVFTAVGQGTGLRVGEKTIDFGTPSSMQKAYDWALENGAMSFKERDVREKIKKGAKIERIITGHGWSPDHMRQTDNYGYVLRSGYYDQGIRIGEPDEPLHKLASSLIEERERGKG